MTKLLFEEMVPISYRKEFVTKVREVSQMLRIEPNWLMLTMRIETAGTFSAAIQNARSRATGLIQFMPSTAKGLGTTIEALAQLSEVEQLDWVYKYLKPYSGRMKDFSDVYLAVFFPAAIGKLDNWTLQTKNLPAEKVASWNPLYDINKDGVIQKCEIKQKLRAFLPKGCEI